MAENENPNPVLEEAMDWLLRLQDAPHDAEVVRQFEAWRSRSPLHDSAWAKARRTWQLMGDVPPSYEHLWKDSHGGAGALLYRDHAATNGRRGRWRGRVAGAIAAAAVALILVFVVPAIMLRMQADYVTATAENRAITLEDGSVATLGASSAIAAKFTDKQRNVTLLSGEAFFEVKPDPSRPFVVAADGVEVTVLGTAFDVRLSSAGVAVELAHGSVNVARDHDGARHDNSLTPGEMIVVDRQTGQALRSRIAQQDIAAWRAGQLFVTNATIGSVVEQLQRYHGAWIMTPDGSLAAQRVTGLYDLRDPDRALRALVQPYGAHVRTISPYLRILSRF